jgi:hypothetical protein
MYPSILPLQSEKPLLRKRGRSRKKEKRKKRTRANGACTAPEIPKSLASSSQWDALRWIDKCNRWGLGGVVVRSYVEEAKIYHSNNIVGCRITCS